MFAAAAREICRCYGVPALLSLGALLVGPQMAGAQGPVVLPYTISTFVSAPTTPMAVGAGKLCNGGGTPAAGNTLPVATDGFNDGCPAAQAILSANDFRGGVATDPLGNLYIADTANLLIRKVDARSGLITVLVGGGTSGGGTGCTTSADKMGDNCTLAQSGIFNNPRGIGADPYGNILIAGYSDQVVHLVCLVASPICSAAQLSTMRVVAGCTTGPANNGTAVIGPDNVPAVSTGTCSSSVGGVDQPRGASADVYGNVYVADTGNNRFRVVLGPATSNGVTNPLYAVIKQAGSPYTTTTAGNIYALFGSQTAAGTQFTVPAKGAACSSGSGATALDANGDGCPFFNTKVTGSANAQAIIADGNGNVFIGDGIGLRVLYVGGSTVAGAIKLNNATITTPVVGSVYLLAGSGQNNNISATPTLGTTTALGNLYKIALDRAGNVYLGDSSSNTAEFFDMQTGYIRAIAKNGTVCTTGATGTPNTLGDGCPATAASISAGNGLGVALDPQNNLYLADIGHAVVRKVSAVSFAPTATGTTSTPSILVHAQPGTTALSPTVAAGSDFTLGSGACMTNAPSGGAGVGENSYDCIYPVSITPTGVGLRTDALSIASTSTATGGTVAAALSSTSNGSSISFDPSSTAAATSTVGSYVASAVALDGSNNSYAVSAGTLYKGTQGTAGASVATGLGTVSALATDSNSNVYFTTGAASIGKLSFTPAATYTTGSIAAAGYTATSVASDPAGNLFFYDSTSKLVVRYSAALGTFTALTATPFNNVSALALDHQGNVLVADLGAAAVYRLPVAGGTQTAVTVSGTIAPVGLAVDAANNLYIADTVSKGVILVPVSGPQTSVATTSASIRGVAVDALGNLYVADSSVTGVTVVNRSAFSYIFPNTSTYLAGLLTNTGNVASTGLVQSDSANFSLFNSTPAPAATCTSGSAPGPGFSCTLDASFLPPSSGGGTLTGTVQLGPVANTLGLLTLQATVAGNAITTSTVIGGQTPASPVYTASGTEVSSTVTVTASSGTPTGSVNVSVDGAAATAYALTAGSGTSATATVALSGLIASNHSIAATYPTTGAFNGSATANPSSFTVAQASTAVNWSPSATTQQYSVAIGTGVFDAYAASGSTVVPGSFVYTATPSGGTVTMVDSASYLPIGSYTLAVTYTPNDTVDYTGSTQTLGSTFTVTKATTTAAVGASTSVVAADGTGNFTSVETAVNALPATGGNIYLAPGSYKEQVLVAVPNVQIHGLGGNPQNVTLTSETGAFGTGTTYAPANPYGFNNDEGSATLVIAKGTVNGTSSTPTNFYLDNISIVNTYDTDTTNTNGVTGSNQTCTGTSTMSNNALYMAGNLCASQALTVWVTADKTVFNNVRLTSLQDTIAAYNTTGSNAAAGIASSSRQYYWKSYITGDIDYVFGDAAAVFDQTQFYTTYHGTAASPQTGNATVFAQNKAQMTGSSNDYLSGYVANNSSFTSQNVSTNPLTALYFGRPYGVYSTTVLINNTVDDVNALGWEPFSGANLATANYFEFGTTCTTSNCSTTGRETTSVQPEMASAAFAARYAPTTFLSMPAPDVWNPTGALTAGINGYIPAATTATINFGQSVTILARPQVPGGGAIPTGTYTLTDNGNSILTGTATGTLDASGAAYLTSNSFAVGTHSLVMTYSGDANFSGSTSTAFTLTVNGTGTTTMVAVLTANPTYGQSVGISATVAAASGATPAGTVNLTVDGGAPISGTLSANGVANFTLTNLPAGSHALSATYVANGADTSSTGTASVSLAKAVLTVTAGTASRAYQTGNPTFPYTVTGYQYSDTASSFSGMPALTTTAVPDSPAGLYPITPSLGTLLSANYSFTFVNGTLTVTGGAAQTIVFGTIPNLPSGTVAPLFGRSTSGLALTYTVTGPATVSGSTITVTGPGSITVTGAQSGNATFAAATPVSRSFTAQ